MLRIVRMTQGKSETRGARMLIRVLAQYRLEQAAGVTRASLDAEQAKRGGGAAGAQSPWRASRADVEQLLSHLDDMEEEKLAGLRGIAGGISKMPVAEGLGLSQRQITRIVAQLQCNSQGTRRPLQGPARPRPSPPPCPRRAATPGTTTERRAQARQGSLARGCAPAPGTP